MEKYSSYDIEKKYSKLTIDELKDIVTNNSKQYRPSVINIIIKILKKRGENIDTSNIEYGNESTIIYDLIDSENSPISLLLLGILFLIISLILSVIVIALEYRELSTLNTIVKLIISIISMKMAYDHAKKLNKAKYLWGFLGLIFGGITLIIASFSKNKKILTEQESINSKNKNEKIVYSSILLIIFFIICFIGIKSFFR